MGTMESLLHVIGPFFPVLFIAPFGVLSVFLVLYGMRRKKAIEAIHRQYPDRPWMWKAEWAAGRIRHRAMGNAVAMIVFAVFWNSIAMPAAFLMWTREPREDWPVLLLISLFPLVGLILIWLAGIAILQWRKYGESVFEMAEVPGVIGGNISGLIEVRAFVQPEDGYHLSLQCVHRVVTGSGKNQHTNETVLWEEKQTLTTGFEIRKPGQTIIPVAFEIPGDTRQTDESNSRDAIMWRLKVDAATPGVDYAASFEVPVFRIGVSAPCVAQDGK